VKTAKCERLTPHVRAPWVRALAGLVALALISAPVAGLFGLLLTALGASRATYEIFYVWFWMTTLIVFLGSLAGAALWAIVGLAEIALALPDETAIRRPRSRVESAQPLDWPPVGTAAAPVKAAARIRAPAPS
jgi:hypothetical protein